MQFVDNILSIWLRMVEKGDFHLISKHQMNVTFLDHSKEVKTKPDKCVIPSPIPSEWNNNGLVVKLTKSY